MAGASEVVLYGPGGADAAFEERLRAITNGLTDGPTQSADYRALAELSLPSPVFAWIASGAETRLCGGAPVTEARIRELIEAAKRHVDYFEEDEARARFAEAEHLLPCASDVLDPQVLWDLYFSAAILAFDVDEAETVRLFRAAALARPEGTWDDSYSPAVQTFYLRGRERAAVAPRVELRVLDGGAGIERVWVDGRPLDTSAGTLDLSADSHLLQIRTRSGSFLSVMLDVRGDSPVSLVTAGGLPGIMLDHGDDTFQSGLRRRLVEHNLPQFSSVWLADRRQDGKLSRLERGRHLGSVSLGLIGPVAKPGLVQDRRGHLLLTGGMMIYPELGQEVEPPLRGAVSLLGGIRLWRGVTLDMGLHNGWVRLNEDYVSWLPSIRIGAHWAFDLDRLRPFAGAVLTVNLHDDRSAGFGPALVGGLRVEALPRLLVGLDLLAGYNRGLFAQIGAGVGVTL